VARLSPDQLWFRHYLEYRCDDCGGTTPYRSRRRSFAERFLLPIFLLQPVRCGECFRRDYRLLFLPVKDRLSPARKKGESAAQPGDYRNVA